MTGRTCNRKGCGNPIPQKAGRGRPSVYCSDDCRSRAKKVRERLRYREANPGYAERRATSNDALAERTRARRLAEDAAKSELRRLIEKSGTKLIRAVESVSASVVRGYGGGPNRKMPDRQRAVLLAIRDATLRPVPKRLLGFAAALKDKHDLRAIGPDDSAFIDQATALNVRNQILRDRDMSDALVTLAHDENHPENGETNT